MKIYLISGKSRHGKDTIGGFIKEYYEKQNKKVCVCQIAKYLKHYVKDYFGWDGNDDIKPRSLFNYLGTDLIRKKMNKPNFFIDRTIEDIEILDNYFDICIVSDVRFKDEITSIKNRFDDVFSLRVNRINFESPLTSEEKNHIVEHDLDDYNDYDWVFTNDTLDKLKIDVYKYLDNEGEVI